MDLDKGMAPRSAPEAPEWCSLCKGKLSHWLTLNPINVEESAHRIYRCEACEQFQWVAEPPGKRT